MQYGLIGAGPVSQYMVRWFPHLSSELGPVAANNSRLASRIVNTLHAGTALRSVKELQDTAMIAICAPGRPLEPLLSCLESAGPDWGGKKVVLCNCELFSRQLKHIRERGGLVASLRPIAGMPKRMLIEGDREALKTARHFVSEMRAIPVEIDPEKVSVFCAAVTFSNSLFTPMLEACALAVRAAGISGSLRDQIVESLFQQGLRGFLYSGKKSWSGTVAEGNHELMERELAGLEGIQPELAELYRVTAAASVRWLAAAKLPAQINAQPAETT